MDIGGSSFISLASALEIAFLFSRHKNSIRHASGLAEREKIHNRERAEEDANLKTDTKRTAFFTFGFLKKDSRKTLI